MQQCYRFALFTISLVIILTSIAHADDDYKRWNNPRDYEPVLFRGDSLPAALLNLPITQLFVFSYNASTDTWTQILFQFDKYDEATERFRAPQSGDLLTTDDEFLFMARDMGDKAPDGSYWIDDADSKNYPRIEIVATDGEQVAYVYVYRSTTLTRTQDTYVNYVPAPTGDGQDQIIAQTYTEGHTEDGIPDLWTLPDGTGVDILDRQKMRIILKVEIFGTLVDFPANEDLLVGFLDRIEVRAGPIRILREAFWNVDVGFGFDPIPFGLPLQYYAYSINSEGVTGTLTADLRVSHIRQSFDLNPNAVGMTFYNPFNTGGIGITGSGGEKGVDDTILDPPGTNWFMFTGDQGTYTFIFKAPELGQTRSLYFWEAQNSDAGDGTADTGDGDSYGDAGLQFDGEDITGRISFNSNAFFLGANKDYSICETLAANFDDPLQTSFDTSEYIEYAEITLSVPDTSARQRSIVQIPVSISDVTGLEVTSIQFDLAYNASILDLLNINNSGAITSDWNTPAFTETGTGATITFAGTTALTGSGKLAWIEFHVIGDYNQTTDINFQNIVFQPETVLGKPTNGSLQVKAGLVYVSLPDTTESSGTSISIPVNVTEVTGLDVTQVICAFSFDPTVLNVTGYRTNGTLTSAWELPTYYELSNRVGFEFNGVTALSGSGPLVYVDFDVIGADGAVSPLNFITFKFNSDIPEAQLTNGSLTIDGVIPVELAFFEVQESDGQVLLNWSTVTESNNYGFEIQRQFKDEETWQRIGFVEGHGTTSVPQSYSFVEQGLPGGTYLYRLKQIDFDGAFEYSETVEVNLTIATTFALGQNYPNPFNPDTRIDYSIPDSENGDQLVSLTIFNMLGEKIRTLISRRQSPGSYSAYWDGTDDSNVPVSTGIYIYRLKAGQYAATKRMVLMK
ncbi:T9SS type A sorting domain-containing protein [candidate division KSB1 bacterium]|nr:T9SS type A sorting domain-containing protein [candidate division KSB1 bacterium]